MVIQVNTHWNVRITGARAPGVIDGSSSEDLEQGAPTPETAGGAGVAGDCVARVGARHYLMWEMTACLKTGLSRTAGWGISRMWEAGNWRIEAVGSERRQDQLWHSWDLGSGIHLLWFLTRVPSAGWTADCLPALALLITGCFSWFRVSTLLLLLPSPPFWLYAAAGILVLRWDRTWASCTRKAESWSSDGQGSPSLLLLYRRCLSSSISLQPLSLSATILLNHVFSVHCVLPIWR